MVEWRVAKSLTALRAQIDAAFPDRWTAYDGTIGDAAHQARTSDHNPWIVDGGGPNVVSARDITHDPDHGCDIGVIFEAIRQSEDKRVKYAIFNRRIFSSYAAHGYAPFTWRPYSNADDMPHDHHGHLSVESAKSLYDDTKEWEIGDTMAKVAMPSYAVQAVARLEKRGYFPNGVKEAETEDMWRTYVFMDRLDRGVRKAIAAGGVTMAAVLAELAARLT